MALIIRVPRLAAYLNGSGTKERRALPRERRDASAANMDGKASTGRPAPRSISVLERLFYVLCLALPCVTLVQTVLARPGEFPAVSSATVHLGQEASTFLVGPRWGFSVPFEVKHKATIEKLIQCESGGRNISVPDSDGLISDGILQFHRGPADTYSGGTWEDFSRASGITGSPRNPADAIRMTDWAIGHGLGPHWSCWRLKKLSPGL